jgi:NADPH:quinone reductase
MPKAIRIHEYGGPEVMRYEDVTVGDPGPGQIRVRQSAIGVNFIDIYFRSGLYKAPQLPFTPGNEGAGTVVSVGEGVTGLKPGERVAYGSAAGTYDDTAAAMMLKGLTTQYLLRRTYRVQPGDTILFHAAAGGVGLIATQWAKHLGATVIGTVGSPDKVALAREHGCDHVILYRDEDFAAKVKEITGGKGCQVVYDGVGQATFPASLDCLRPFGYFVNFGSASGPVTQFDINLLAQKGSLYATRPTLFTHTADRAVLDEMAADLFEVVKSGAVKIPVHARAKLADAPKVHADLAGRQTTGATVMHP